MAESDSGENAMAEKAREIIASQSYEELATLVNQLFMRQESEEYQTARAVYNICVSDSPNHLTLKLLKLYQCSSNGVTRFQSIYQLSEKLNEFRNSNFKLSFESLSEIKPLLISCLTKKETKEYDIKILRRIVSFVAYNVVTLYHGKWEELSGCIFFLANKEPLQAFHVFVDLPPVYKEFIYRFMSKILVKAKNVFGNLRQVRVEDWSLALQIVVKIGIHLLNTEMKVEVMNMLMKNPVSSFLASVNMLVKKEKERFLVRGLEGFQRFLSREVSLYCYNKEQCDFVSESMIKIGEVGGTQTKEIVRKINMLVTKPGYPAIKPHDDLKNNDTAEFDRSWYDHLKTLSSLEVLRIFASTQLEDRARELAIRQLNVLLSDHIKEKVKIEISEFKELKPLLISCLKEEGVSESMFKVLGEVVNHVANETFVYQDEKWDGLRDYIVSQSKLEFERAVYIFQCLTMPLLDDDFVIPVWDSLLPEIMTMLTPPREYLIDNISWVLAFTGAFCAAINVTDIPSKAKEITDKMIDSVRELVERKMELGLVRRAFRDVETIVKKQLDWYNKSEYKFLKRLLRRLYTIKDMKCESKIVLWRINLIVGKKANELPKDEFDWQNVEEEEDEDDEDEDEEDEEDKDDENDKDKDDDDDKGEQKLVFGV